MIWLGACEAQKPQLPEALPSASDITLTTEPAGATIVVDGIPIGTGPQTVKLNPGPHRLKALLNAYFPAEQRITVNGREKQTITLTLVASH